MYLPIAYSTRLWNTTNIVINKLISNGKAINRYFWTTAIITTLAILSGVTYASPTSNLTPYNPQTDYTQNELYTIPNDIGGLVSQELPILKEESATKPLPPSYPLSWSNPIPYDQESFYSRRGTDKESWSIIDMKTWDKSNINTTDIKLKEPIENPVTSPPSIWAAMVGAVFFRIFLDFFNNRDIKK